MCSAHSVQLAGGSEKSRLRRVNSASEERLGSLSSQPCKVRADRAPRAFQPLRPSQPSSAPGVHLRRPGRGSHSPFVLGKAMGEERSKRWEQGRERGKVHKAPWRSGLSRHFSAASSLWKGVIDYFLRQTSSEHLLWARAQSDLPSAAPSTTAAEAGAPLPEEEEGTTEQSTEE